VRLRRDRKQIARDRLRVRPGKRARATLRLPGSIRRRLARHGSLRMSAVISGHRAGSTAATVRLRVLAARR
jgi:hypothetical protein